MGKKHRHLRIELPGASEAPTVDGSPQEDSPVRAEAPPLPKEPAAVVPSPAASMAAAGGPKPGSPAEPRHRERFYRVAAETRVPREHGGYYTLVADQVISTFGYDVPELVRLGVPLTEVERPGNPQRMAVVIQ